MLVADAEFQYVRHLLRRAEEDAQAKQAAATSQTHLAAAASQDHQAAQNKAGFPDFFDPSAGLAGLGADGGILQCAGSTCQAVGIGGGGVIPDIIPPYVNPLSPYYPLYPGQPTYVVDGGGVRVLPGYNPVPCPNGVVGSCATG